MKQIEELMAMTTHANGMSFEKAEFVNSDTQLYKQAGNGVTVNVIYEIAKRLSLQDLTESYKEGEYNGSIKD